MAVIQGGSFTDRAGTLVVGNEERNYAGIVIAGGRVTTAVGRRRINGLKIIVGSAPATPTTGQLWPRGNSR